MIEPPDQQDSWGRTARGPAYPPASPDQITSWAATGTTSADSRTRITTQAKARTSSRSHRARAGSSALRSVLRSALVGGLVLGALSAGIAVARVGVRDSPPATSAEVPPTTPEDTASISATPTDAASGPGAQPETGSDPTAPVRRKVPAASAPGSASRPPSASPPPSTPRPRPVPKKFRFTAKTVDGETFKGSSLAGKPTVLFFWQSWCGVCRGEAPGVARVAKKYEGKVNFVGVAGSGNHEDLSKFVDETGLGSVTNVVDSDGKLWSSFGASAVPSIAYVTKKGKIEMQAGGAGEDHLAAKTAELIR
jgi:thiol-disulfide isomerase/thioredoxin